MFKRCQETFACFLHTPTRAALFEVTPEEREAFFEKLYAERGFGIWQGNFRDILTDREGQRADLRFRRPQNPPARQGPDGRGEADPEKSWLWHAPRAAGDEVLRGLQPAQRQAGRHQRKRRSSGSRRPASRPATPNTNSTSSSTRPDSTPSPAAFDRIDIRGVGGHAAEGQMAARPGDLSRRHGRRLSQHDDADGAAHGAGQHSAQHRIQCRLGDRPDAPRARQRPDPAGGHRGRASRPGPIT